MRFYTKQHRYSCGIDLHARTMYVCILNQDGETAFHRNLPSTPDAFLRAIAPYREGLVVAATAGRRPKRSRSRLGSRSNSIPRAVSLGWRPSGPLGCFETSRRSVEHRARGSEHRGAVSGGRARRPVEVACSFANNPG